MADPSLIAQAPSTRPSLRSVRSVWRRLATRDDTRRRRGVPAGTKLCLWIAATGRDPDGSTTPTGSTSPRADARHHIAFGKGIHFCLGANLARSKPRIAIE